MAIADVSERSVAELVSLSGRRAVVTGGAQGLGKAIARRLAEAGAAVVVSSLKSAAVGGGTLAGSGSGIAASIASSAALLRG